jgi:predicted MFS family arabinose efflux permease
VQPSTISASLFVFGIAIGFGVFVGSRARRPLAAFFLAWFTTPVAGCVTSFLIAICSPVPNSVGWLLLLEMPIIGIGLGLIAGVAATLITRRREKIAVPDVARDITGVQ